MTSVDNTGARQSTNRKNARFFAQAGLYVFPSDGKIPLVPRYNRADTSLSKAERAQAIEEYIEKHGYAPAHVGATKDDKVLVDLWRKFPDAVPSISCGPSKLVVLDADLKDEGPAKLRALFDEHEGPPAGVHLNPTKSGGQHYVFADKGGEFSNRAGLLKKDYGTDVRGTGGQFVGPGSIREDGATYGTQQDKQAFVRAFVNGKLPPLPDYIVDLIGAAPEGAQDESVTPSQERAVIKLLQDAEWDQHENDFDETLGKYDLEKLKRENIEFAKLYDNPGSDCSTNRFLAARHVMREWPDMSAPALAYFLSQWAGSGEYTDDKPTTGEYDNRQIAREWIKNQGLKKEHHSDGSAFDAVDDADERDYDQSEASHWYENAISIPVGLDINKLPPRPYLYGKYLMRGHLSLLSAAGGVGKSAWTLDSAIDIACGVDHLGAGEFKPRKVLVYNGEDDQDELLRRVGAQFVHHEFTPEMRAMVRENLTLISGVKASMRLAEYKDGRVVLKEKVFDKLAEIIDVRKIDIVVLDPLIALHSIPENANAEMNVVMTRLKNLAAAKQIALLLAHHDKKNITSKSVDDANQDDARGAGTITTPTRVVLNMRRLSKRDAQTWRIPPEDAPHIIALSAGAKSNYSTRDVVPKLFYAHSVQADNGTEEFAADSTVALSAYTLPTRQDGSGGIGDEATLKVLAALDGGEPVGSDSRHANWIGRLIADATGWDADAKHVRESIRDVIANWTARDWITEAVLEASGKGAERRKSVKVYKRGASRPTPRVYEFDPVDDEDEEA